jgi:hypothetical protein
MHSLTQLSVGGLGPHLSKKPEFRRDAGFNDVFRKPQTSKSDSQDLYRPCESLPKTLNAV